MSLMLPLLFSLALTSPDLQTRVDALMAKTQLIAESSLAVHKDGQWVMLETQYPLGEVAAHVSTEAPLKKVKQVIFRDGMDTLFKAEHPAFNSGNTSLFYWGPHQPLTLVLQTDPSKVPGLVQLADLEAARGEPFTDRQLKKLRKGKLRTDFDNQGTGALLQLKDTLFHMDLQTGAVTFLDPVKLGLVDANVYDSQLMYRCDVMVTPLEIFEIGPGGQLVNVFRGKQKQKVADFFGRKDKLSSLHKLKAPHNPDVALPKQLGPNAGDYLILGQWLFDRKGHVLSSDVRGDVNCAYALNAPVIVGRRKAKMAVFDTDKARVVRNIDLPELGYDMTVGNDGQYLAIVVGKRPHAKENSHYVYNLSSGAIVEELPKDVTKIYMIHQNMIFCAMDGHKNEIVVIDTQSNQVTIPYEKWGHPFLGHLKMKDRRDDEMGYVNSGFVDGHRIYFREPPFIHYGPAPRPPLFNL